MTTGNILGKPPTDLSEAIKRIIDLAKKEGSESVFEMSLDGFQANMHMAIGQIIRNEWLWGQDSKIYKELSGRFFLSHADDLSGIILKAVYNTWHKKPLELDEEAAKCHRHWADTLENHGSNFRLSMRNTHMRTDLIVMDVFDKARELIDDVVERYDIKSYAGFTCPKMRALAKSLKYFE